MYADTNFEMLVVGRGVVAAGMSSQCLVAVSSSESEILMEQDASTRCKALVQPWQRVGSDTHAGAPAAVWPQAHADAGRRSSTRMLS